MRFRVRCRAGAAGRRVAGRNPATHSHCLPYLSSPKSSCTRTPYAHAQREGISQPMVLDNQRERASIIEARQRLPDSACRPAVQAGGLIPCFHDDIVSVSIAMRVNGGATRSCSEVGDARQLPPCLSIPGLFVHQQAHAEHERARKREFTSVEGHCRWARRGRAYRSGRRTTCRTGPRERHRRLSLLGSRDGDHLASLARRGLDDSGAQVAVGASPVGVGKLGVRSAGRRAFVT